VTVQYATADGGATAGSDYQAVGGTLTFAPGETSKTITVPVNGDRLPEPNETFFVNLGNATNATIADGQGVGTIADDDAEPALTINDVPLPRATSGRSTPPSLSASTRRAGATSPSTSRPLTSRRTHRPTTWGQAGR
jgi:Calx-beta domain